MKMSRISCVLAAIVVAVGATAVVAQNDPISVRQGLMKKNSQHGKAVSGIVKGAQPFDQATVNAAFAQWADTAAQLPKLFPDNSKDGKTRAHPKIWSDRAGFNAEIAALAKASSAKPTNLEELKTAYAAVNKVCGECHEGYRTAAKK
jgi:cytochrome c556